MRIFLILFAVTSLSTAESPLYSENILSLYVRTNTAIREILKNMSSTFDFVNTETTKLILNINQNITYIRRICGSRKYEYFRNKYNQKYNEFKRQPELDESCLREARNLLAQNEWEQQGLMESINESLDYWKGEYNKFDQIIADTRFDLTGLEEQSNRCSHNFKGNDDPNVLRCAGVAFAKAKEIGLNMPSEISRQLTSLIDCKDETLESLYKKLENRNIFRFYGDRHRIDDWFAINCPLPPKIVVTSY